MLPDHITSLDGLRLHLRHWPVDNARGVVMLVHGLAEYIERYDHVASAFNAAGLAVAGLDHRAHGKSEGARRAFVPQIEPLVTDAEMLWEQLKPAYPDAPRFVMGHSMGGLVALLFTLRHQAEIQALVVSAPGLTTRVHVPGPLVSAVDRFGKWLPSLPTLSFKAEHISRSVDVMRLYDNDPLIERGPVRLGTARSLLVAGREVLRQAHRLTLPIFVLHGGADKIVSPAASKRLFEGLASGDKSLKVYPGLHHEILNEPEQDTVIDDILQWMTAHLPD